MQEAFQDFVFFFAVIDPIGTIPVFIAVTKHLEERQKFEVAVKSTLISFFVLIFFVVAGELILTAIDIPLSAFQISGGIILLLFSLTMIFGEGKPEDELKMIAHHHQTAVFPLAMPSIASPGAIMAAVMLTEKDRYNLLEQLQTTASMALVLLLTMILMLLATSIYRLIGTSGASVVSRVMGMILAALAVTHVLAGISDYFGL